MSTQGIYELALSKVKDKTASNIYTLQDIENIKNRKLIFGPRGERSLNDITPKQLELLRELCSLYDNDIRVKEISSHRKFIGPIIVNAKKFLLSIIKFLLKDYVRQNRAFQATSIRLLVEMMHEKGNLNA